MVQQGFPDLYPMLQSQNKNNNIYMHLHWPLNILEVQSVIGLQSSLFKKMSWKKV